MEKAPGFSVPYAQCCSGQGPFARPSAPRKSQIWRTWELVGSPLCSQGSREIARRECDWLKHKTGLMLSQVGGCANFVADILTNFNI